MSNPLTTLHSPRPPTSRALTKPHDAHPVPALPQTPHKTAVSTSKLFHIFYTTFFYTLYLCLFGLLLVTPGDAIHQALQNKQLYNVFVIAAAYFVTALLAVLIYASRIYTTRSVLGSIPRAWVPVEEGDVSKGVRSVVKSGLGRSAGVAWLSRPQVGGCREGTNALTLAVEIEERKERRAVKQNGVKKLLRKLRKNDYANISAAGSRRQSGEEQLERTITENRALCDRAKLCDHVGVWGVISHPGWSPPTSKDLPNLHYQPVIAELPHLIEAKVIELSGVTPQTVAVLRRPINMGMREYLGVLGELGCFGASSINGDESEDELEEKLDEEEGEDWRNWLEAYERARFSGDAVTEAEFRSLMSGFASLLSRVRGLDGQIGGESEEDDPSDWDEGEAESDKASLPSSQHSSLQSKKSQQSFQSHRDGSVRTTGTTRTAGTVEKHSEHSSVARQAAQPPPHTPVKQQAPPKAWNERGFEMEEMNLSPAYGTPAMPYGYEAARPMTARSESLPDVDTASEFGSEAGSVIRHKPEVFGRMLDVPRRSVDTTESGTLILEGTQRLRASRRWYERTGGSGNDID